MAKILYIIDPESEYIIHPTLEELRIKNEVITAIVVNKQNVESTLNLAKDPANGFDAIILGNLNAARSDCNRAHINGIDPVAFAKEVVATGKPVIAFDYTGQNDRHIRANIQSPDAMLRQVRDAGVRVVDSLLKSDNDDPHNRLEFALKEALTTKSGRSLGGTPAHPDFLRPPNVTGSS